MIVEAALALIVAPIGGLIWGQHKKVIKLKAEIAQLEDKLRNVEKEVYPRSNRGAAKPL